MFDRLLGAAQWWLQGHGYPPPYRPWLLVRLGNRISDFRFERWLRVKENRDAFYGAVDGGLIELRENTSMSNAHEFHVEDGT